MTTDAPSDIRNLGAPNEEAGSMNADAYGTPAEQRRARAQWRPAALRQGQAAHVFDHHCCYCRHCVRRVGWRCKKHRFTTEAKAACPDFDARVGE